MIAFSKGTGNREPGTEANRVLPGQRPVVLRETAYGKLNLTLDILGKRPDGYHDLEMVMISVDLADELELTLDAGAGWSVTCDRADLPQNEGNLCWKAARRYFDAAGLDLRDLEIRICKRIPAQAGMAGGSSDAAAVLRALNRHYRRFTEPQLRTIGLEVGSDVPYCLFGGVALARGRGEILTRLPELPRELCFVLVQPDFAISTPALFREIDRAGLTARPDTEAMLRAIEAGDVTAMGRLLENAFEPAVSSAYPVVQTLRRRMLEAGALGARLTGTGSVVFGLFDDKAKARTAAEALRGSCPQVWFTSAVNARP